MESKNKSIVLQILHAERQQNRTLEREIKVKIIIILIFLFIVYLLGYFAGYRQCEDMTQKVINQIMEECEEKKVHKIKEPNKFD